MKPTDKINLSDIEALTRRLSAQKITPPRFSLEVPWKEAANAIYAAMKAEVMFRRRTIVLDDDTRSHIEQAARWITDPHGKSGLLLLGPCGNGKTTLMRAIARLIAFLTEETLGYSKRKTVRLTSAKEIARVCAADRSSRGDYFGLFSEPMLAIDDLGTEPSEVISYGMTHTPLIDLLCERYDRQLLTMVTTNLIGKSIGDLYGKRVHDRLSEVMEIIQFNNPSYRT